MQHCLVLIAYQHYIGFLRELIGLPIDKFQNRVGKMPGATLAYTTQCLLTFQCNTHLNLVRTSSLDKPNDCHTPSPNPQLLWYNHTKLNTNQARLMIRLQLTYVTTCRQEVQWTVQDSSHPQLLRTYNLRRTKLHTERPSYTYWSVIPLSALAGNASFALTNWLCSICYPTWLCSICYLSCCFKHGRRFAVLLHFPPTISQGSWGCCTIHGWHVMSLGIVS